MNVEIRQLRCLVAVMDAGSFTDAAIELGVSQAAVSRSVSTLESTLGVRLLRRTTRSVSPTSAGAPVLARARRLLADLESLIQDAVTGHDRLRIGYAWSAVGRHTVALQRQWAAERPDTDVQLVRNNSASAGLAEGSCELAILRNTPDPRRFESVIVGLERRYCVMATDDALARRRSVVLADFAGRTLGIDRRTGTTTGELWAGRSGPSKIVDTLDIDDWLGLIAAGGMVGMTTEATAALHRRPGVAYRLVRDAPPVAVHLAWWRDEPPPATPAVVELLTRLYREA
ncbi:LysR family transcriptional regulator [Nakamurella silvestris]|nr:LysR family transcriptional regulator [Nakamurella silvestris]